MYAGYADVVFAGCADVVYAWCADVVYAECWCCVCWVCWCCKNHNNPSINMEDNFKTAKCFHCEWISLWVKTYPNYKEAEHLRIAFNNSQITNGSWRQIKRKCPLEFLWWRLWGGLLAAGISFDKELNTEIILSSTCIFQEIILNIIINKNRNIHIYLEIPKL